MHANQSIQKTTEKVWAQFINGILWENKEKLNIFELFDLYSFHRCTLVGIYICQYAPICITERHYGLGGKNLWMHLHSLSKSILVSITYKAPLRALSHNEPDFVYLLSLKSWLSKLIILKTLLIYLPFNQIKSEGYCN